MCCSNCLSHLNLILTILGDSRYINCSSITLRTAFKKYGQSIRRNFIKLFYLNVASKLLIFKDNFNSWLLISSSLYLTEKATNNFFMSMEQENCKSIYRRVIFPKQSNK